MKVEEIKTIVKLMAENDLTEFKIESQEYNLCIKRGGAAPAAAAPDPAKIIESPLVGTFYRAASPDAAPFVQIGSKVTEDTTVCIIEAMKVMNEVKAEKTGIIKEILVENGNPVEYGMPIFVIE